MFRRKTIIANPSIDLFKSKAVKNIGITIPFNNPNGVFYQSVTNRDQVYSNLKNLLLTGKGERYFEPEFGTDIRAVLFENINDDEEFKDKLRGEIESSVNRWLPYLIIQRCEVNINMTNGEVDDSDHAVGILLRVLIAGTNIYLPVRIFISESATIRVTEEAQN